MTFLENDTLELINPTSISGHSVCTASKVSFSLEDNNHSEFVQINDSVKDSFLKIPSLCSISVLSNDLSTNGSGISVPYTLSSKNSMYNYSKIIQL